ncbi:hypothetical protein [Kiloniella sp.]|uniref:hypothetical protein n=1 Tax=Kiloniella sp. TaxID=1938587 RepID=UPI003A90656A
MRKYVEALNRQVYQLTSEYERNNTPIPSDLLKAIKRIEWIALSVLEAEPEHNPFPTWDEGLSEKIRNKKFDADQSLYDKLVSENESSLLKISPRSLVRYVPLLETPD